ncbi:MAG TPA: winged helix-turn-helix domain-containing protein [Thermoanaerobaculia bacterium]|nr:winged helix-turn-helix domain-containing protein [Thermoanaerobaculia bacterium]
MGEFTVGEFRLGEFKVGEFTVEPKRQSVAQGGRRLLLEPNAMKVLLALAEEPGTVVSRERLLARVWGDKFVTDEVLTRAVYLLRNAFGDDPRRPRYIETIRGSGYVLVAPVLPVDQPAGAGGPRGESLPMAGLAGALLAMALLGPRRRSPPAVSSRARRPTRAYLEGQYFLGRRDSSGYRRAVQRFQTALAADPLDAEVHAALAQSHLLLGLYRSGVQPVPMAVERARAGARRALALDSRQAQAQAVLGTVAWAFDYDFANGGRHLREALARDPRNATVRQWLSWLLLVDGRPEEATSELSAAAELDPLSAIIATARGTQALYRGQPEEAERLVRVALEMEPRFARAHLTLGLIHEASGELDSATAHLERAAVAMGFTAEARAALAHCQARRGDRTAAEQTLRQLTAASAGTGDSAAFEIALLHDVLGRRGEALGWLAKGLRRRTIPSYGLLLDPRQRDLRRDPGFSSVLAALPPRCVS